MTSGQLRAATLAPGHVHRDRVEPCRRRSPAVDTLLDGGLAARTPSPAGNGPFLVSDYDEDCLYLNVWRPDLAGRRTWRYRDACIRDAGADSGHDRGHRR